MTADLSALIARLEAAEVGSRELDHLIFMHTAPMEVASHWSPSDRMTFFTTSLDAALALAERVHGEARALDLLQDVLSLHGASSIAIRDLPRLLCSFILRAKQGEGE